MAPPRVSGVRRLGALLQQSREPVFVLDGQDRLLFVNRAWEDLTGYPLEKVVGLACVPGHALVEDDDKDSSPGLGPSFSPPAESRRGEPSGATSLIVRADGERLWRRVEFWPYHDESGNRIGTFGLVRPLDAKPNVPTTPDQRLRTELLELREWLRSSYGLDSLIGRGPSHERLLEQIRAAATTAVPVLIVGEPGSGRRTVARAIHDLSANRTSPLISLDCAALPSEMLERTLFGERREGASVFGHVELPLRTSLLLLEVAELSRDLQARLTEATSRSRFRLLATSSLDPSQCREQDRIRADLYYALTVMVIQLAPLRERLDELPLFAQFFLERAVQRDRQSYKVSFEEDAMQVLSAYDWPGNLREFKRVIDYAITRAPGDLVRASDLPAMIRGKLGAAYLPPTLPMARTPLDETLTFVERRLIERALADSRQNKSRAAELLDISRPRLYRRIKELQIPDEAEATNNGSAVSDPVR